MRRILLAICLLMSGCSSLQASDQTSADHTVLATPQTVESKIFTGSP